MSGWCQDEFLDEQTSCKLVCTCWPSRCGYLHLVFPMNFKQNKSICCVLIWILHCKIYGYYFTSCFVYNITTNLGAGIMQSVKGEVSQMLTFAHALVWNNKKGLTCIYYVLFWTAICSFIIINILYDNQFNRI